jgi:hypothetical protein
MEKKWKPYNLDWCPNCGAELEVNSECPESEDTHSRIYICDGEEVRCVDCDYNSAISADEDGVWLQDV